MKDVIYTKTTGLKYNVTFEQERSHKYVHTPRNFLLKYVESKFFGNPILTPESTEEEILNVFDEDWSFNDEDTQEEVRRALKEGKTVYSGSVCYEECEYYYAAMFERIWKIMRENGEGDFVEIDGDLSY